MLELINPYIAKIAITARDGDSVRQISRKIMESYGWTYNWISKLDEIGAVKRKKQSIKINHENLFYKGLKEFITSALKKSLSLNDAYLLPNLSGLEYIFTGIDAIFIWTKGGYNIGRSKDSYPIFIDILEKDKSKWESYFSSLGIKYAFKNERKKGIYFVIRTCSAIQKEYLDKTPVLPLNETAGWAERYPFNFEPALEMLDEMYGLKTGVKYKEA